MSDDDNRLHDEANNSLMKLFDESEIGYLQRLKNMFAGLSKPRDSKEFKEAKIELQRLAAPLLAILLPTFFVLLLMVLAAVAPEKDRIIDTQVLEMQETPDLEKVEPPEPPPPTDQVNVDISVNAPSAIAPDTVSPTTTESSPQPAAFDSVVAVKSPVIFKGVFSDARSTGTRGNKLQRFGGDKQTEEAVMAALRWMKKNQSANGALFKGSPVAMTGLGVLTFLAHGERPGAPECEEFGETVQKAVQYLIDQQRPDGRFNNVDGHEYSHPIATYALCEAYGMTMNPNVGKAATLALGPIIKGQQPTGGWDYNMKLTTRSDISYMGWCAQALKAGHLARVNADGLEKAYKLSIKGMKFNVTSQGTFCYAREAGKPAAGGAVGLTAVGTLCMQLLGGSSDPDCRKGISIVDTFTPTFEVTNIGASPQYYYYYATQVKFFEGGGKWQAWNKMMKPVYVNSQKKLSGEYTYKGKDYDIGYWENKDGATVRPFMDTCLVALQLMVYYRNLPTTSINVTEVEVEKEISANQKGDIAVDAGNL